MKKLKKLFDKPVVGPLAKMAADYLVNREVKGIAKHFSTFLRPVLAVNDELKQESFKIRHEVYCSELGFEPVKESEQEFDPFDAFAFHCLIQHISTERYAGTVRVVTPQTTDQQIPLEKFCGDSITSGKLHPSNFNRQDICEISRLAVPNEFRRRRMDKYSGAGTGVINQQTYSETELRCFPFIAISLYFSAASVVIERGIAHTFVMMEPRLARSMRFVGIEFEQLGPTVDYHGKRAPYYINPKLLMKNLSPAFTLMLEGVEEALHDQLEHGIKEHQQRMANLTWPAPAFG